MPVPINFAAWRALTLAPWRWIGRRRLKPGVKHWVTNVFTPNAKPSGPYKSHIFDRHQGTFLIADGPETFVVSAQDKAIGRTVFATGGYDLDKLEKVRRLYQKPTKNMVFIDVGANIGTMCIPAVKRGYFARTIAIEPEPLNVRLLKANIALNDLDEKTNVIANAVGREAGTAMLHLCDHNLGDHRVGFGSGNEAGRTAVEVEIDTLDNLIPPQTRPDVFLWMDTQGYEGFGLAGGAETIAHAPPLVIEFCPHFMRQSQSFAPLWQALSGAPYLYFYDLSAENPVRQPLTKAAFETLFETYDVGEAYTDLFITGQA